MFEPLHTGVDREVGEHRHIVVTRSRIIVRADGDIESQSLRRHEAAAVLGRDPGDLLLGRLDDTHYWASHLDDDAELALPDDHHLSDLRSLHGRLSDDEWNIAGRATQLVDWVRDHRYCGRCGLETEPASNMRAMRCPACGLTSFPRLSPAVIVLIERDDGRCLLGRNGLWDIPMYSTLAGFVEPGETLEDTVHREVFEEVGVRVKNIRYFGSQPWPFPNSLMLGFVAAYEDGEI
ncbi:MAG: NAD(+) diphosphatase, partial [Acidimicrobiales bacterium]